MTTKLVLAALLAKDLIISLPLDPLETPKKKETTKKEALPVEYTPYKPVQMRAGVHMAINTRLGLVLPTSCTDDLFK